MFKSVSRRICGLSAGMTLLEVLVATSILAAVGVVFLLATTTSYKSVGILDEKTQAEALARTELEHIRGMAYSDTGNYSINVSMPLQYSMNISVTLPQKIGTVGNYTSLYALWGNVTTIQEITVFVYRPAGQGQRLVFSSGEYKLKIQ